MNNFNRKWWYLLFVLGFVSLAIVIIQIILGIRPSYSQNVIIDIIRWLDIMIAAWCFYSMPTTGAVGDERTIRALEKASIYAFLILVGCLILLSGAYILGGTNSFLLAAKDSPWTPIIVGHIGIYSWIILVYYFVKKGE
ncbi:MAG: hypothetical protein O8C66_13510 [Candidatus Methanoperedens sp.]|nr:hypothetical protein [Candidatus Methanoperedens sp.]MCZ7371515.1 hypothetical protein [Candidatus Methanoperedens sp.]